MVFQIIPALDFQEIFVTEIIGDVEGKGLVSTFVETDALPVQKNVRTGIHCAKVQKNSALVEALGEDEGSAVVCGKEI